MPENEDQKPEESASGWAYIKALILGPARPLVTGIIIGLVVVLGYSTYKGNEAQKLAEASEMLFSAKTPDDLEAISERYSNTPSGPIALLHLAKAQFHAEKFDDAISAYSIFEFTYPEHEMLPIAQLGKIFCAEAKGHVPQAKEAFAAFASQLDSDHYLQPQALLGQARCAELMDQFQQAKTVYEDFLVNNPGNPWIGIVESALEDVNLKIQRQQRVKPPKLKTVAGPVKNPSDPILAVGPTIKAAQPESEPKKR